MSLEHTLMRAGTGRKQDALSPVKLLLRASATACIGEIAMALECRFCDPLPPAAVIRDPPRTLLPLGETCR